MASETATKTAASEAPTPAKPMTRGVLLAYFSLGVVMLVANFAPVPVAAQMIVTTLLIIYIGSVTAVRVEGEALEGEVEFLETKDAYMFPIVGGGVLLSLYLVFKFFKKEYVNYVIKAYFFIFGILVLTAKISQILATLLPAGLVGSLTAKSYKFELSCFNNLFGGKKKGEEEDEKAIAKAKADSTVEFNHLDLVAFAFSAAIGVWYIATNHWAASNIFGIAFSIQGIELLNLGSFFNGCVLLCGLFFYDIFFVFGTDVMVTVAKSFDAPIKLLFPQIDKALNPSLLGLGDIVIPGIFIAQMLRFDHFICKSGGKADAKGFSQWYFISQMVFYAAGLGTTVFVMYAFQSAQPALLYLVPAALTSAFGTALLKGDLKTLWAYTEEDPTKDADKKSDAKKKE